MIARMLRVEVGAERIGAVIKRYQEVVRPIHAQARGLKKHYVLADREAGRITIIGIWESDEAVRAIGPSLEPARAQLWAEFAEQPALEYYEVADEL